jgi:predicted transcriptional regulator
MERQVALLVAWGATKKQVAELLHLSAKAVDGYLARHDEQPPAEQAGPSSAKEAT